MGMWLLWGFVSSQNRCVHALSRTAGILVEDRCLFLAPFRLCSLWSRTWHIYMTVQQIHGVTKVKRDGPQFEKTIPLTQESDDHMFRTSGSGETSAHTSHGLSAAALSAKYP